MKRIRIAAFVTLLAMVLLPDIVPLGGNGGVRLLPLCPHKDVQDFPVLTAQPVGQLTHFAEDEDGNPGEAALANPGDTGDTGSTETGESRGFSRVVGEMWMDNRYAVGRCTVSVLEETAIVGSGIHHRLGRFRFRERGGKVFYSVGFDLWDERVVQLRRYKDRECFVVLRKAKEEGDVEELACVIPIDPLGAPRGTSTTRKDGE